MSIAEIKNEIRHMPIQEQDELAAYLTVVRLSRKSDFRSELRDLRVEEDQAKWMSLDDLKSSLGDS